MSADPALALAVAYLRPNGHFLITEPDLHLREDGGYRAHTDIDIIAVRPPTATGPPHHHRGEQAEECLIATEADTVSARSELDEEWCAARTCRRRGNLSGRLS